MPTSLNNLEKAIIATVAYFDIFDYPLSLVEIHKWLYNQSREKTNLSDILPVLESGELNSVIESKDGFYFLKGRQEIIRKRLDHYNIAEPKFKIALKTIWWLHWLAFIEMIAVCNNLGYNNTIKEGDIDFFIIIKKNRLWWTRLMVTLVVSLLGIRRHGKKIANRICLSFYIANDHLNLEELTLKPNDCYLTYWLATLAPVYNREETYQKFLGANDWLKNYLPNFYPTFLSNRRRIKDNRWIKFSKRIDEKVLSGFVGRWLERLAKFIQLKKMEGNLTSVANQPDTRVVISDSILKFHETDKRSQFQQLWQTKISEILNNL